MFDWTNRFTCACGCGAAIKTKRFFGVGTKHYASNSCRQRAFRDRSRKRNGSSRLKA